MSSASSLKGKTLFITGASRGIGLAIATRAAADGANIVILAKTTDPNPKLPGTIYSAAEAVKAAGGQALPLAVDIREEEAVAAAVAKAVEAFGGIDILVNNASAISLTDTEHTPMKRYDLMNGINARGTYLCTQACLAELKKSAQAGRNPQVLTMSPPLSMKQHWFENHTAYSMAKYGMSMCTLGHSGEFKIRHRRQQPLAAHGHCHRRAADDSWRGFETVPQAGNSFRCRVFDPHQHGHADWQLLYRRRVAGCEWRERSGEVFGDTGHEEFHSGLFCRLGNTSQPTPRHALHASHPRTRRPTSHPQPG